MMADVARTPISDIQSSYAGDIVGTQVGSASNPMTIDLTEPVQTPRTEKPFIFSTPAAAKPTILVEIKGGKLVLKQKLLPLERMMSTMKEMVAFNEMLQSLSAPLTSIPAAHLPLIAKLAFESDKTVNILAKRLKATLLPETGSDDQDDGDTEESVKLPVNALEEAIGSMCERINYGVDGASAAMSLWRWEVKDLDMLPADVREKAVKRRTEREQAKRDVCVVLEGLSEEERTKLLPHKEKMILKDGMGKASEKASEKTPKAKEKENVTPEPTGKQETPTNLQQSAESGKRTIIRPRKILEMEPASVIKEKQEKAAMKAEQRRKTGADQAKAAANMTAWLGKGKGKPIARPVASPSTASPARSEFDRYFQPFVVKKDVELAPVNHFTSGKWASKSRSELIVLDSEGDVVMETEDNLEAPADLLEDFLARVPSERKVRGSCSSRKTHSRHCVRDIISQITEAEVIGDDRLVRQLRGCLRNGRSVPVKLLQFHDNVRPAYFGTWTKSSAAIGPRVPFARDITTLDYSYDSGDDWNEEEENGEDVMSDNGSATPELDSDEEDEFAGWMVEDDEVEEGQEPASPPPDFDWPAPPPKRKVEPAQESKNKRRKVITQLIPYTKGPCWEDTIGVCEYEPFLDYRLHFLNDVPFPLDPFSFVSPPVVQEASATANPVAQKAAPVAEQTAGPGGSTPTAVPPDNNGKARAAVPLPKHPFPEQHLAALLQAIEGSTKPRPVLLEDLFASFRHLGVKKNAIDAKLREVCVKEKKVWKVLDEAWTNIGVGAPMTVA